MSRELGEIIKSICYKGSLLFKEYNFKETHVRPILRKVDRECLEFFLVVHDYRQIN